MNIALGTFLNEWLFFKFSDKLKFAIKVSLSLTLAYMIPMAMGWAQPNTAAITVMLIASVGGVSESVTKGIIRVIGTIIGATLGIVLISLFPQDRLLYLLALSLIVSVITYLYYAYQGDSTVFMLSAMVMMMIYLSGPANAFIYGIDRTYMTIFGIVIYTFVGIFLWPFKAPSKSLNDEPKGVRFIWLDPEYFKATLQLFSVFWFSVAFWIYLNPPGGFLVVILASMLGLLTTFSPLKPSVLIILFSLGFIFATLMYVFVLPNLVYAWELALFLFIYTFIAFYLINPKLTIFFLLGLFVLGVENSMSYNFDVFLMTLLIFYMFLVILMFFYNFPFSAKPEHLFTLLKERFFKHSFALAKLKKKDTLSWFEKIRLNYYLIHQQRSVLKLKLWGSKIDAAYFNQVSKEEINEFISECEKYLLNDVSLESCYNTSSKINWQSLKVNKF